MNCNVELHNELEESGDIYCPFCDVKLQDCSVKHDLCCNLQDIIHESGIETTFSHLTNEQKSNLTENNKQCT